jgi:hypothetical protein
MNFLKVKLILALIVILLFTACNPAETLSTPQPSTPPVLAATPTLTLATPYAIQPASGICASSETETIVVTINPDIPDPRCSKVRPDQTLSVVNNTMNTLQVSIGTFNFSLLPQAEYTIQVAFGEYLLPGVHQLSVSPCCGAEIWLESK